MPDEKVDQNAAPAPPAKPSAEQMFEMNKTVEGRAAVAKLFGVVNEEAVGDNVIDVFEPGDKEGPALRDEMVKSFGGEQGFAAASADLTEAILIADPAGEFGKAVEKMSRAEEAQAVKGVIAEWRSILATPEKAQEILTGLYMNPESEPMRSYIRGSASATVSNAVTRLWQAAYGEKPTGIPPRGGNGLKY